MKTLTAAVCAFGAAFGLAISASAETETIAYWPFGTNGFHDVSGNGHDLVGNEVADQGSNAMIATLKKFSDYVRAFEPTRPVGIALIAWYSFVPPSSASTVTVPSVPVVSTVYRISPLTDGTTVMSRICRTGVATRRTGRWMPV